jgi:hypothetical protein
MIQTGTEGAVAPVEHPATPADTSPTPPAEPIVSAAATPPAAPAPSEPPAISDEAQAEAQPHPKRTPRKPRQFVSDDTFDTWVAARERERQASLIQAQAENQVAAGRSERRRLFALLREAMSREPSDDQEPDQDPIVDDPLARRVHDAPEAVRRTIAALLDLQLGRRRGRRAR